MNGSIDNATVAVGGTSHVVVAGLKDKVVVNLAGTATVSLGVTSGGKSASTSCLVFHSDIGKRPASMSSLMSGARNERQFFNAMKNADSN